MRAREPGDEATPTAAILEPMKLDEVSETDSDEVNSDIASYMTLPGYSNS